MSSLNWYTLVLVTRQHLFETFMNDLIKRLLTDEISFCHFLSYSVILKSLVVKVPQVLSVLNAKGTKGLSLGSVILKEMG